MSDRNDIVKARTQAKSDLTYNGFLALLLGVIALGLLLLGKNIGGWLMFGVLWFGAKAFIAMRKMQQMTNPVK